MKRLLLLVVSMLVLAACAPMATPQPTSPPMPTATPIPPTATPAPQTIVDIAVADGRFTTLVKAVQAAGLVETLKSEGPFTVFAPTDEAFAKLPAGTLESLLKPANKKQLTDILLYHVVSGRVLVEDVVKLERAETVLGKPVMIKVQDGKVFVNEAQVVLTDIKTTNGVIHVIDTVILPPR